MSGYNNSSFNSLQKTNKIILSFEEERDLNWILKCCLYHFYSFLLTENEKLFIRVLKRCDFKFRWTKWIRHPMCA